MRPRKADQIRRRIKCSIVLVLRLGGKLNQLFLCVYFKSTFFILAAVELFLYTESYHYHRYSDFHES